MTVRVLEEVWLSSRNLTLLEKFDVEPTNVSVDASEIG